MQQYFLKRIQETATKLLEYPWHSEEFYATWLAQTYYYVSHSTRLLALSASRFTINKDSLHQRFLKHCQEEKKHEHLALKDLQKLNKSISSYPELPATQNFYQTQYYWIEHVSPECFFGYIIALEGLAVEVGKSLCKKIKASHPSCLFMDVHANEDPDHLEKAFQMIFQDLKDPNVLKLVQENFEQALENYLGILRACEQGSVVLKRKKAA